MIITSLDSPSENKSLLLWKDPAFWGMTATQFLGAFNDNVFKQMILLLAISTVSTNGGDAAAEPGNDLQGVAMIAFAIPFLLFSSYAGYLSEIYSKRTVIVLSKVAEFVVMSLGVAAFLLHASFGVTALIVVLFLMGAQSAFFGPSKYGILPEMLRPRDLGRANGVILMTTFLGIIFGAVFAGLLVQLLSDRLYLAGSVCVLIAVVGTATSLWVRYTPPANPDLPLDWEAVTAPKDVRALLWSDSPLLLAVMASCAFWLVGGVVQPTVNAFGKTQLGMNDFWTSLLNAGVGLGIAAGCVVAGMWSREVVNFRLMRIGLWGIVVTLAAMSLPGVGESNLLGYWGSLSCLILLGVFTGFFAVPVQVFIQSRPPAGIKGRLIATVNLANWVAIVIAAVLYLAFGSITRAMQWQPSVVFAWTALLMLPAALLYRPNDESL